MWPYAATDMRHYTLLAFCCLRCQPPEAVPFFGFSLPCSCSPFSPICSPPPFFIPYDFEVQVVASVLAKSFGKSRVNGHYSIVLAIVQPRLDPLYGPGTIILPRHVTQIFSIKQEMDQHSLVN